MKHSLLNIITKIINNVKKTIFNTSNNFKFEGKKNNVIKVMYSPLIDEKGKEERMLSTELKRLKEEENKLNDKINAIEKENKFYDKKIAAVNSFRKFLAASNYKA